MQFHTLSPKQLAIAAIVFPVIGVLSGCVGAFVPIESAECAGAVVFEAGSQIRVVDAQETKVLKSLGIVEGYSCKNKLWDPAATADAATLQVKVAAAQRGATAISGTTCAEGGSSLATNCWQSFKCVGEAFK